MTFVSQDVFLGVLALYGATVAFGRWFPDADLIAIGAHASSITPTIKAASESARVMYMASLVVDIIRHYALCTLEATAFSFAFVDDIFKPFCYVPFFLTTVINVTKDALLIGATYKYPEELLPQGYEKIQELLTLGYKVELGLYVYGLASLAVGLYKWTYAIGRDKRQVIKEKKTE